VFRTVDGALALDPQLCSQLDADAQAGGKPLDPELLAAAQAAAGAADPTAAAAAAATDPAADPAAAEPAPPAGPAPAAAEATAEDMLPLAERLGACVELMYAQWRDALDKAARSRAAERRAVDDLRAERQVRGGASRCIARGIRGTGGMQVFAMTV